MRPVVARGRERDPAERERYTEERCHIFETWNDASDPGLSIARARVEPGVTTALHSLDVDERYVILSGRGRVEVEGIPPSEVEGGDVIAIPAGRTQRIQNLGSTDLVFLCLCTPRFAPEHYRNREKLP
jgi:mannose-6-phosphate isomerase-like protein (cupin superfamily)